MNKGKLVIMIITGLLLIITTQAKAEQIVHATYASTRICNNEYTANCTSGYTTLSNTNPNSEIISVESGDRWESQTIAYGLLFQYNNNKRPIDTYINFPFNSGLTGLVFDFSFLSQLPSGQVAGQGAIVPIYAKVQYSDNTQEKCAIVEVGNTNYNETMYFEERQFRCVFNKEPAVIIVEYLPNGTNYTNLKYYISYNNYIRAPASETEISEIQTAILNQSRISGEDIKNLWNASQITINPDYQTNPSNNNYVNMLFYEGAIQNHNTSMNWNNMQVSQDTNTKNFIWETATRILNTNALIMGLMISALSICIIRLYMGG